ncbi:MAG: DUF4276 family protein [Acidobacteriota bacterium]
MIRGIRIYVEGGGKGKDSKGLVQKGFRAFFKSAADLARGKQIHFDVIACGSINSTLEDFNIALQTHKDAFNVLLVDSDGPVRVGPREHLRARGGLKLRGSVVDESCHLMVQTVEAWLIADVAALKQFYGQEFSASAIPGNTNVEEINKANLYSSLKAATRRTQKGQYHKVIHGAELLKKVDVAQVRNRAPHCDRLFATIQRKISAR